MPGCAECDVGKTLNYYAIRSVEMLCIHGERRDIGNGGITRRRYLYLVPASYFLPSSPGRRGRTEEGASYLLSNYSSLISFSIGIGSVSEAFSEIEDAPSGVVIRIADDC